MKTENKQSESKPARRTLLIFDVAGQRYAIQSSDVEQITPMAEVQRPPEAPKLLIGFLNLAGAPIPVVGMRHLFTQPAVPIGLWSPLIILAGPKRQMALLVDNVSRVVSVSDDDILPLPHGHCLNNCADGIVRLSEGAAVLLSVERLLLEQEEQTLAELQRHAQDRLRELDGSIA